MTARERRLQEFRARVQVRSWQYRQRNHAAGVWFRLRRVLAAASAAYAVSPEEAATLGEEGYRPVPVGGEIEPQKTILVVPAARVASLESARPVPLRLGGELMATTCLVLAPFEPPAR